MPSSRGLIDERTHQGHAAVRRRGHHEGALVDTPKAWAAQVPLKPSDEPGADIAAPRHGRISVRYGQVK